MAKRFTATELWEEDWFLDMPNEYKLLWYYMLSKCDHAGVYRVNLKTFDKLLSAKLNSVTALEYFNAGKKRIRVLSENLWFIEDFFVFQYGATFNWNNKVHDSIGKIYNKHSINIKEFRGLVEVKERLNRPRVEDTLAPKDKDKDKDILGGGSGEVRYNDSMLSPMMVKEFKKAYPFYPVSEQEDFSACLQIAYKIAKQKGWTKDSVLNGKMSETIAAWIKIVEFSTTDKWYATRSISDFNKEFQRIVQSMAHGNKIGKEKKNENQSSSPSLSYLPKQ